MARSRLSLEEARQIAVRASVLDATPVADLESVVRALAMLRVELTPAVAPAADHIAWVRLGSSYRAGDADRALSEGRLFERDWMLRPMEDLALFTAGMRTWADRTGARRWMEPNARFRRAILDRIAEEGPLTSRDIPDGAAVPWPSSGWNNNRNVSMMLQCLHMSGDLAVVGRRGRLRIWDLAENVFPEVEEVPVEEAHRIRSERILTAFGIVRDGTSIVPAELHNVDLVGEPVTIDGAPGKWRVDPSQLDREFDGRTALLSPFDRLVTDRERLAHVFEFDYLLEMYKPAEERLWGQFALPILHNDRLVGKVDARSEPKRGVFSVRAVHQDEPFTPAIRDAVDEQIDSLAGWLGLAVARA
ncbi:MAG: hypothetical protein JWQ12_2004 [Glaciihabitans sp.]|nr:hypothetical protein [Glaciihabitans sp.]